MRIVSSRHEPFVKNIRSGFNGKRELSKKKRERVRERERRRRRGERPHAAASSTVSVRSPSRESSCSIPFFAWKAHERVNYLASANHGDFLRKNICFGFSSAVLVLVTGSARRAQYINYAGIRCTKVAKRRNRGWRNAAKPDLTLRRGKSLSCPFLN